MKFKTPFNRKNPTGGAFASFGLAVASFALYWAALPAVGLKYAIFLVPAFWATLTLRDDFYRSAKKVNSQNDAISANDAISVETPKIGRFRQIGRFFLRCARRTAALFFGGTYRRYWTAAFLFWLAAVVWVSYPHPATTLGWLALAGYLAFYFPLFTGINRILTRRFAVPIWVAAPIAWTAVEWARNRALGGFSFAGLSHSLYDFPRFIQIAGPLGEYGVGATVVFVGTLLGLGVFGRKRIKSANWRNDNSNATADKTVKSEKNDAVFGFRFAVRYWLVAAAALGATVYFGQKRLDYFDELERAATERGARPFRIALLQDGTTYRFPVPSAQNRQVEETYLKLAAEASRAEPGFDAIVWPESCFGGLYCDFSFESKKTRRNSNDATLDSASENAENSDINANSVAISPDFDVDAALSDLAKRRRAAARLTARLGTAAILGTTSVSFDENGATTFYNSAIFVPYFGDAAIVSALPNDVFESTPTNSPVSPTLPLPSNSPDPREAPAFRRYDKIRLVMFGEYIPFVEYLPDAFPLKAVCADFALGRGNGPTAFALTRRADFVQNPQTAQTALPDALILAPNVCFESSIPQFIESQVRDLTAAGAAPDVLVNVSNVGWFRNGIQTDMQLATQVFRALETGKTVVSATHGGFSAWVDPAGRVRARGERGASEVVSAEILRLNYERSPIYWGEIFAAVCAAFGFGALGWATILRIFRKFRVNF